MSIWCSGDYMEEEIMQLVNRCWEEGISAKWYSQFLLEKDESCRNNIIIRKKIGRIYLMLKKNVLENKKEPSFIAKDQFDYTVIASLKSKKSSTSSIS